MKNPIKKKILEGKIRLGTALMALTMIGSTPRMLMNPIVENVYATETEQSNDTEYNNIDFNGDIDSIIDPRFKYDTDGKTIIPIDNVGTEQREYRAIQSACYDGKYFICAQNKAYGESYKTSNKGGRITWTNAETGLFEGSIEIGEEGKHMDGVAYDSDRNIVLIPSSSKEGNLLLIDNYTKRFATIRYTNMPEDYNKLTYVPTIHKLVALEHGKFIIMSYSKDKNEYVKENEVTLEDYHTKCGAQGIGTDGKNIFIADSGPGEETSSSDFRVWTYSLDGKKLEEHKIGSGFNKSEKKDNLIATNNGVNKEVESALSDNEGNLWLICSGGIIKAKDYKANSAGINNGYSNINNKDSSTKPNYVNVSDPIAKTAMKIEFLDPTELGSKHAKDFGDCTIISSEGEYLVVDTFNSPEWDVVKKHLDEKENDDSIQSGALIVSHVHEDHIKNADNIIKRFKKLKKVYLPDEDLKEYRIIEKQAKKKGIEVIKVKPGFEFNVGKVKANILSGLKGSLQNNRSLVIKFSVETATGTTRLLMCGDIEKTAEKALVDSKIDIESEIVKTNHHGLYTSNTKEFIKAVAGSDGIIDIVLDNNYTNTREQFPTTRKDVVNLKKGIYPWDESFSQIKRYAEYANAIYNVEHVGTVTIDISDFGKYNVNIDHNVDERKYIIVDEKTGKAISTDLFEFSKNSQVKGYNPRNELPKGQKEAIQAQLSAGKAVGDMVYIENCNSTNIIRVNVDINNLAKSGQNSASSNVTLSNLNTTGENMVEPRARDIPNLAERLFGTVVGLLGGKRKYSMVIPMPETKGIICDECGSYEDPNQLYSLNSEKMYPAYYAVNPKFDTAEKNCRVIKDEIVDKSGNIKEIYALVKNESLLKTVRVAIALKDTKLTTSDGKEYLVPVGTRDIIIVGNTAILQDGRNAAGTIPSSDLYPYNDKWKEVSIEANDMHLYFDNITKQYVWGSRTGRKKMTICSPENIKITDDNKKCLGTEVKEQTPGEFEARFKLIGKLGEKEKDNQNEMEK